MGMASFAAVGVAMTIGVGVAAMMYLNGDLVVAAVGLAPLAGGVACLILLRTRNVYPALATFAAACVSFTILATSVAAPRVSPYQTSPRIAARLAEIERSGGGATTEFATFKYTKPNIVFYLGRPVAALVDDEQAAQFLARNENNVLVLPADVYESIRSLLPLDVSVIHIEEQFMKPDEKVMIVGRQALVARLPIGAASTFK